MKKTTTLLATLFLLQHFLIAQKQWLPTNSVSTHRYDDVFFVNDSVGYAIGGDVYKTVDFGKNWNLVFKPQLFSRSIEFINEKVGFIGSLSDLHYRTLDGGLTWTPMFHQVFLGKNGICGMSHIDSSIFACGAYSGTPTFYRTDDLGVNWEANRLDSLSSGLVDCHFFTKNKGIITGIGSSRSDFGASIFLTKDGGKTFKNVCTISSNDSIKYGTYCWKIQFLDDSTGFVSVQDKVDGQYHIAKTTDQGETWQITSFNLPSTLNLRIQGIYFEDKLTGWIGGWFNGMYQTKDGGANWQYLPTAGNLNRFFKTPRGDVFASGHKIFKYDFVYPTAVNEEMPILKFNKIDIYPNPVKNQLMIKLDLFKTSIVTIKIRSIDGKTDRLLLHETINEGEKLVSISISDLPAGSYIIDFLTDYNHEYKKIVIER